MKKKDTQLEFRRPVEILEVWRSVRLFEKNAVPATERHAPALWTPFDVKAWAADAGIMLTDDLAQSIDPLTTRLLVFIADHPSGNHRSYVPAGLQALTGPKRLKLDIIDVDPQGDWPIYLAADELATPRRAAFQAAALAPGQSVEIRVNEKADGHHQRMYIEYQYLLRRSGPFSAALATSAPVRALPPKEHRLVDLRKPLW